MKLAIAQLNQMVGDLPANARRILESAAQARAAGASLVVTPELSLCGYPPEDLVLRPAFLDACASELAALAAQVTSGVLLVGFPERHEAQRHNAMAVIRDGRVAQVYRKQCLPNYTVFDEQRYFTPADAPCRVRRRRRAFRARHLRGHLVSGTRRARASGRRAGAGGAERLAVPPATKQQLRLEQTVARAGETGAAHRLCQPCRRPGRTGVRRRVVRARRGRRGGAQVPAWHEASRSSISSVRKPKHVRGALDPTLEAQVYAALVLGVRDYVGKNGFPGVLLGLSGGIDSALVLAIAVDALGADKVRAVMMPSPYTADISWIDARDMAERLGVRYDEISIEPMFEAFQAVAGAGVHGPAARTRPRRTSRRASAACC